MYIWRDGKYKYRITLLNVHVSMFYFFSPHISVVSTLITENVDIWRPGNETQQSIIFVARLRAARTIPADSTVLDLHWSDVKFSRDVLQSDTFYVYTLQRLYYGYLYSSNECVLPPPLSICPNHIMLYHISL